MEKPGLLGLAVGLAAMAAGAAALAFNAGILNWLPIAIGAAMVVNGAAQMLMHGGVLAKNRKMLSDGATGECLASSMLWIASADGAPSAAAWVRMDEVVRGLLQVPFGPVEAAPWLGRPDLESVVLAAAGKAQADRRDVILRAGVAVAAADGALSPARSRRLARLANALGLSDVLPERLAEGLAAPGA